MSTKLNSSQKSRKGKREWRKNVDVSSISEGLENLRTEIIQGGVIAEKSDDALFAVDTVGSTSIAQKAAARRGVKPLKADEILNKRSAVPALESRKRPLNPNLTDGVFESSRKKRRADGVSFSDLQRLRRIAYGPDAAGGDQMIVTKGASDIEKKDLYDPWSEAAAAEEEEAAIMDETMEYVEKKKPKVIPVTLKHAPISLAKSKAPIPAVRFPDAGISYNPEFEKWDQLLTREGDKEVEAEKKRIVQREREELIQRKALEVDPEVSESEDEEEEGEGEKETFVKKRPERKTQAQRNKIKRRKEAEREVKRLNYIKKQKMQLQMIRKLAQEAGGKEKERLRQLAIKGGIDPDADIETLRKRKFGKYKMPQAPLELQLPDELADSLRLLKPEGNLLRDRYRSLLERGIIETRQRLSQRKKARQKVTEKWSYKDWTFK